MELEIYQWLVPLISIFFFTIFKKKENSNQYRYLVNFLDYHYDIGNYTK